MLQLLHWCYPWTALILANQNVEIFMGHLKNGWSFIVAFFTALVGLHKVLTTSLAAPRLQYTLRELDVCHVQVLKAELLSRPLSLSGKPIFVIAKGLTDVDKFDEKDLDSYELEVIGGNHRREAMKEIIKTSTSNETKELFKYVYVQIHAGKRLKTCFLREASI